MADDVLVVETGEPRTFGGNEVDIDRVAPFIVGLPETCRPERFWMISMVNPGP